MSEDPLGIRERIESRERASAPSPNRLIRNLVTFAVMLAVVGPPVLDYAEDAQLAIRFAGKLDVTIAPHPDRLPSRWLAGEVRLRDAIDRAGKEAAASAEDPGEQQEPMTFWQRILFVIKTGKDWLNKPPEEATSLENQIYFWSLAAFLSFLVAARVFGTRRVVTVVSGLFGPDRWKKLIIDMVFLKGAERQIFPNVRQTVTQSAVMAVTSLNRVELHDIVRVTVAVQGEGQVECWSESVTLEGRAAYTFCPGISGSGGDYYFNLKTVSTRSVRVKGNLTLTASSTKGHVGRVRFDITGFKRSAWE